LSLDLLDALHQLEREKGIPVQTLVRTIEASLVSAYRKNYGGAGDIRVEIGWEHGSFHVFARRTVVSEPGSEHSEIALNEAQRYRPEVKAGEIIEFEVTPENFGRIAAQTAKQVMVQRIREAERERIFDEFSGKEGELVTGEVQRRERRNLCVNVGQVEALLPPSEQVEDEDYRLGQHLKFYILEVRKTTRSPQVVLSRSHPGLVKRLFELEVPELHEGIVELKGISRHAGTRSKIAVHSHDANVDPVGACVGHRGSRVQAVVEELGGEKIDIIRWSAVLEEYIAAALSPAKVPTVLLSTTNSACTVVVPEDQLSLAIGKAGQNVRLAAKLTGLRIDIKSQQQHADEQATVAAAGRAAAVEAARVATEAAEAVALAAAEQSAAETAAESGPESPVVEPAAVEAAEAVAESPVAAEITEVVAEASAEVVGESPAAGGEPEPVEPAIAATEAAPPAAEPELDPTLLEPTAEPAPPAEAASVPPAAIVEEAEAAVPVVERALEPAPPGTPTELPDPASQVIVLAPEAAGVEGPAESVVASPEEPPAPAAVEEIAQAAS